MKFFQLLCIVVLSFCSIQLRAQLTDVASASTGYNPSAPFFTFSGNTRLYAESSSRQGYFSERPRQYAFWEFNPTFALFGIPFGVNVLYSTEDDSLRQHINMAALSLDPTILKNYIISRAQAKAEEYLAKYEGELESAKDSIAMYGDSLAKYNPERLKELEETVRMYDIRGMSAKDVLARRDLLEKAGLLSTFEKVMLWMPRVVVGTSYPSYNEFTLNGIGVNGVDFEWNPGKFYMAFTTGKVLNPIQQYIRYPVNVIKNPDSTIIQPIYGRNLTAFRIGYGRRDDTYFILTAMKAKDDATTQPYDSTKISTDTVPTVSDVTPQENYVVDFEGNVSLFEDRWILRGEVAGSLFTSDTRSSDIQFGDSTNSDVPGIVKDNINLKVSSFIDWSALANTTVNIPETATRFSATARRIGAGFRSLGLLNQRNDYIRYDVRIDQGLFSRQLSVGGFVRRDLDNLISWKRNTTEIFAYGVTLGISPRKLPYIRAMYSPYYQRNDATNDTFKVQNTTSLLSLTTGYAYQLFDVSNNTTLSYTTNTIRSFKAISDFDLSSITLGHSVSFSFPLTVSASVGLIKQNSTIKDFQQINITNIDINANYTLFDVWNLNAGINLANEKNASTRTGFFFGTTVPIWKIAVFDLRAEKNTFSTINTNAGQFLADFNETIVRATLSKSW